MVALNAGASVVEVFHPAHYPAQLLEEKWHTLNLIPHKSRHWVASGMHSRRLSTRKRGFLGRLEKLNVAQKQRLKNTKNVKNRTLEKLFSHPAQIPHFWCFLEEVRFRSRAPNYRITPFHDVSEPAFLLEGAGFSLSHGVSQVSMTYQQFDGISVGMCRYQRIHIPTKPQTDYGPAIVIAQTQPTKKSI